MSTRSSSLRGRSAHVAVEYPISVRFPPALRLRTERFAATSHLGLATAIRTIVGEYLDDLDARKSLTRAEEWQRAQAWATAQDLRADEVPETSLSDLRRDQEEALARLDGRRRR